MTIETIPGSDLHYYLVNLDQDGSERHDPQSPAGRMSDRLVEEIATRPGTDCRFMSHGWHGDIPAAQRQYDPWSAAMLGCTEDVARLRASRPGFMPLVIGVPWPSLPCGEEDPTARGVSFAPGEPDPVEGWIKDAASKLADTPTAREALRTLFDSALEELSPADLPAEVTAACQTLAWEAGVGAKGPAGAPGADVDQFDPEGVYQEAREQRDSFGGIPGVGALLGPLRQLSFWQMKARASGIGESGVASLLRRLLTLAGGRDVRFRLMGHSFGCIVVSAAVNGAGGDSPLPGPVHSLFLAQGALSLWAYCSDIPVAKGKVAGPIVPTQSQHDTAVRVLYPRARASRDRWTLPPVVSPGSGVSASSASRGRVSRRRTASCFPPSRPTGSVAVRSTTWKQAASSTRAVGH